MSNSSRDKAIDPSLNGYLANESINARDDQGNISGYPTDHHEHLIFY